MYMLQRTPCHKATCSPQPGGMTLVHNALIKPHLSKWSLLVFPRSYSEENHTFFSMYLYILNASHDGTCGWGDILHTRLGRFPGSTRFTIENQKCGSTLLKNRVLASTCIGSRTETFKYPIPKAGLSEPVPAKYPVLGTDSAPIEIPGCLQLVRAESQNTWFSLMRLDRCLQCLLSGVSQAWPAGLRENGMSAKVTVVLQLGKVLRVYTSTDAKWLMYFQYGMDGSTVPCVVVYMGWYNWLIAPIPEACGFPQALRWKWILTGSGKTKLYARHVARLVKLHAKR